MFTEYSHPIIGIQAIPIFNTKCLSEFETYAEKFWAALTGKDAAIRDFYDI